MNALLVAAAVLIAAAAAPLRARAFFNPAVGPVCSNITLAPVLPTACANFQAGICNEVLPKCTVTGCPYLGGAAGCDFVNATELQAALAPIEASTSCASLGGSGPGGCGFVDAAELQAALAPIVEQTSCASLGGPSGCDFVDAAELAASNAALHTPVAGVATSRVNAQGTRCTVTVGQTTPNFAASPISYDCRINSGQNSVKITATCPPNYIVVQNSCAALLPQQDGAARLSAVVAGEGACEFDKPPAGEQRRFSQYAMCLPVTPASGAAAAAVAEAWRQELAAARP